MRSLARLSWVVLACACIACGKKGPPLPPLVRLPAAPVDVSAERRGSQVEVRLRTPAANTDGSRPAELTRVDVYAFTGNERLSDDLSVKRGARIGSVVVRRPADDAAAAADSDEADGGAATPQAAPTADAATSDGGVDQGAMATVRETVGSGTAMAPGAIGVLTPADNGATAMRWTPLAGQFAAPLVGVPAPGQRTYVAVGVTRRGRRGPFSARVAVPLGPAPGTPGPLDLSYTETAVTVRWAPAAPRVSSATAEAPVSGDGADTAGGGAPLASRVLLAPAGRTAYHVYDAASGSSRRLTTSPIPDLSFVDQRIAWGEERCYVVRAAETIDGLTVEGDPSERRCVTLTDTFPPGAPGGLTAIASEGAINLIWEPNREADLAGYRVLRDAGGTGVFVPATPTPITDTTFRDSVGSGVTAVYAVEAVDKAGNASPRSPSVQETAR